MNAIDLHLWPLLLPGKMNIQVGSNILPIGRIFPHQFFQVRLPLSEAVVQSHLLSCAVSTLCRITYKTAPPTLSSLGNWSLGISHNAAGVGSERRLSVAGLWVMGTWIISHAI